MKKKKEKRVLRKIGIANILVPITPLPEGWAHHSDGYIVPTIGIWKNRPIKINSGFSKLLGWPGPCLEQLDL